MPHFRIDLVDGTSQRSEALRVMRSVDYTVLEGRQDGDWVAKLTVPTNQVVAVYQRLTERNGAWQWVVVQRNRALGQRHFAHLRPAAPPVVNSSDG